MNLLSKLRQIFSGRANVIQTREGVVRLPAASARPYWIVGRSLCLYRNEDLSNVPRSKRRAALELKLPVWSPFERTGHHCVWSGGSAMVWFWDEDAVGPGAAPDARRSGARGRAAQAVRPETLFYPRKPDGVHLQVCREGFELQLWVGDVLADAFWFPERPDERQLLWFLGSEETTAPNEPAAFAPMVSEAAIAPDPWPVSRTPGEWVEANERPLVAVCLLALALAVVWHEARIWKIRHLEAAAAAELVRLQDRIGPLLEARNEFVRERRTNLALRALLHEPSQAHIMGLVDRALPSAEAEFREWRYQQRELRVVVTDPVPDPIAYVRRLEAEPLFEQVKAEPARGEHGENRLEITLRVQE